MRKRSPAVKELSTLPAIGTSLAEDLESIGVRSVAQLKRKNPEKLYAQLCAKQKARLDPCVLYSFRCACYAARGGKNKRLRLWWNWKERTL